MVPEKLCCLLIFGLFPGIYDISKEVEPSSDHRPLKGIPYESLINTPLMLELEWEYSIMERGVELRLY